MHSFAVMSQVLYLQGLDQLLVGPWSSKGRLHSILLSLSSCLVSRGRHSSWGIPRGRPRGSSRVPQQVADDSQLHAALPSLHAG